MSYITIQDYPRRPIKCSNCGKTMAYGEVPAKIEIKCHHCGTLNSLNFTADTRSFSERLGIEKKVVPPFGFNCAGDVVDATGYKLKKS